MTTRRDYITQRLQAALNNLAGVSRADAATSALVTQAETQIREALEEVRR